MKTFGCFRILFVYIIWVFYDQSDDIVEQYIWACWREFETKINVVFTQDDISKTVYLTQHAAPPLRQGRHAVPHLSGGGASSTLD